MSQHRLVQVFIMIGKSKTLAGQNDNKAICQDDRQSLVLVKLEELETHQLTNEMKYLVNSMTYLAWPQNGKT